MTLYTKLGWLVAFLLGFVPMHMAGALDLTQGGKYISALDDSLTIRKVVVVPPVDNMSGIYARPLEHKLIELVSNTHQWDYVDYQFSTSLPILSELERDSQNVRTLLKPVSADAALTAYLSKGPKGISLTLDLFLKSDGGLLVQETLFDHPRYELEEVHAQLSRMYERLLKKLPYSGVLLSRAQNLVTINLGRLDGIKAGQEISCVQIIGVQRHPKFNFLISSEKEILGKIKIQKVDDTLSFGSVIFEKERGSVKKLCKISGINSVDYQPSNAFSPTSQITKDDLAGRPEQVLAFGNNPTAWVPEPSPTFGQASLQLGLGNYAGHLSLSGVQRIEAVAPIYPSIHFNGELWLTPKWTLQGEISQGILSVSNPREGSSPQSLSVSVRKYGLRVGYNFLLKDDFWGPKVQILAGFSSYGFFFDDSDPRGFNTMTYSGINLGLQGSLPLADGSLWAAGARFDLFLRPQLSEAPESSGRSINTITDFGFFVDYRFSSKILVTGGLDFELITSSFSGSAVRVEPGTNASHRSTTLKGGIKYLF